MVAHASDTFSDFEQHIRERMQKAYQRVFGGSPGSPNFCPPYMEPPVDVYQTDTEVVVIVEMAGIPNEEIELEVNGQTLTIRGERKPVPGRAKRVYSQMEIASGPFQREVLLPAAVNASGVEAVYSNGILEIALPRSEPNTGRHLRIIVH